MRTSTESHVSLMGLVEDLVPWIVPRLIVYLAVAAISALCFVVGAAVYSYFIAPPLAVSDAAKSPGSSGAPPDQKKQPFRRMKPAAPKDLDKETKLVTPPKAREPVEVLSIGIARRFITVARSGSELEVTLVMANLSSPPMQVFADRGDVELYILGQHWWAKSSFGINLCDRKLECSTDEEKERHSVYIESGASLPIKFRFSGYDNLPDVGTEVNLRMTILGHSVRPGINEGSKTPRWIEFFLYEPGIPVQ